MIKEFFSLIFPQNCINCKQSLNSEEAYLCTSCKIDLPLTNDYKYSENELYQKFAFEPKIKSARSFLYYINRGITQKLLYSLKYHGKKDIGVLMGSWLASVCHDLSGIDRVVPVPLHKRKLKKRTYNQSEVIGRSLAKIMELSIDTTLVQRVIETKSQTRKSKVERWSNVQNVYSNVEKDLTNESILIIDDVITTGATIGMLCERLVDANAKEIHIVSLARGK